MQRAISCASYQLLKYTAFMDGVDVQTSEEAHSIGN